MLNLVKKARNAALGETSMEWLKPFMTQRKYRQGDVLFKKGDAANEMFLTGAKALSKVIRPLGPPLPYLIRIGRGSLLPSFNGRPFLPAPIRPRTTMTGKTAIA